MGLPPSVMQLGGDTLPTQAPAVPVPVVPGANSDPTQQINSQTQKIMQAIAQAANRKQMSATAVPAQVPGREDASAALGIGMNTSNPHAWGTQRFLYGLGANIKNAVATQKQNQLLKAEGDWSYLQSSMNELFQAQQAGDQQAIAAAQKKVDVVMQDPKKLKNMAKALNQDWLNPEKTTVYGEALKNVVKKTGQQDAAKAQAKQGIMDIFKKLIQKNQQPQLSPEQTQAMGREIQSKAPTTTGAETPADLAKEAEAVANLAYAQKQLRDTPDKYEFKTARNADGSERIVAVDKTNPKAPAIDVKSESGENLNKAGKQFAGEGKLEVIGGRPTGRVMHGGTFLAPGQKGFTKEDQEAVNLGLNTAGLNEADKEKLAKLRGSSYAFNKALYTPVPVVDANTGESGFASQMDVVRNPGKYVQSTEAEKIGAREAVHGSLNVNFAALEKSLKALPNGLDTTTQAIIQQGLRSDDPGFFDTLIINKVKEHAPDEVLQYLTNIKVMHEDILVLRTVGGMGQGSDMMRAAMIRTVPGAGTSSVKEGLMQIAGAKRTSEALFKGRPKTGPMGAEAPEGGKGGTVKMKAPDGTVQPVPADQVDHYKKMGATVVE